MLKFIIIPTLGAEFLGEYVGGHDLVNKLLVTRYKCVLWHGRLHKVGLLYVHLLLVRELLLLWEWLLWKRLLRVQASHRCAMVVRNARL